MCRQSCFFLLGFGLVVGLFIVAARPVVHPIGDPQRVVEPEVCRVEFPIAVDVDRGSVVTSRSTTSRYIVPDMLFSGSR